MGFYREYANHNIDLAPFGVKLMPSSRGCFCTPRNAAILGEGLSDGTHYCFIRGYGEVVFVVSPQNKPGEYVHAVARDFRDFLRLLLAVGSSRVLESIHLLDRSDFDALLVSVSQEQLAALRPLGITPMPEPFEYLTDLQSSIDMKNVKFPAGCPMPTDSENSWASWQVFYGRGFAEAGGRSKPCSELHLGKSFEWLGKSWQLLSVYVGAGGLMLDVLEPDRNTEDYSACAVANSRPLSSTKKDDARLDGDLNDMRSMGIAEHYSLKFDCGQSVSRWCFPWPRRRKPILRELTLTFSRGDDRIELTLM